MNPMRRPEHAHEAMRCSSRHADVWIASKCNEAVSTANMPDIGLYSREGRQPEPLR